MSKLLKWKHETPISIEREMKPLFGLRKTVNEALDDFYNFFETGNFNLEQFENRSLAPSMDIAETDDYFNVEIEMPGMSEEDIKINISEDRLTIQGEKSTSTKHKDKNYLSREITYGQYYRSINLPPSANADKATATFKKGMLWIKIPKKANNKSHSREIKIEKA